VSTEALWSQLNQKMQDHMQSISLHSLIADELKKVGQVPNNHSPKRGVFIQKPLTTVNARVPNSVFALGKL